MFTRIMATNEDIPDFPLLSSMDIPVVLYNLLHSLLSSNSMNGWSIYEAKNGNINVNIRFSSECAVMASDPALPVMPATWRKQTSKQTARSKARADQHRQSQQPRQSPPHTRSKTLVINNDNTSDIETPRSEHSNMSINNVYMSPEVVVQSPGPGVIIGFGSGSRSPAVQSPDIQRHVVQSPDVQSLVVQTPGVQSHIVQLPAVPNVSRLFFSQQ